MFKHPVHQNFNYDKKSDKSQCNICKIEMCGKHSENLMRHLKRKHAEIATEIISKKKQKTDEQKTITNYLKASMPSTVTIKMTAQELREACLELVTKNGRPLKMLEDSGFKKIVDPICRALDLKINRQNIRDDIIKGAAKIRSNITLCLKNRLISLKMDCVTRLDRSILGINVQYCEKGEINILTLAMKEIKVQHISLNLANILIDVLGTYEVTLDQVYAVTTDNAANMICMGNILNKRVEESASNSRLLLNQHNQSRIISVEEAENDDSDETYNGNTSHDSNETDDENRSDDDEENDDDDDERDANISIYDISSDLESNFASENIITIIRCASHTLNLAVCDFIKEIEPIRSKARTVVKKLRTPTMLNLLRLAKKRKPILECVTRWGSTYNMFKRLLELKPFCLKSAKDIKELHIQERDWKEIENICDTLQPAFDISIKMQKRNLLLSDSFFAWYSCNLKVEKKLGLLNYKFASALKKRGKLLLENPCVLAAVFLDPRYQILLSDTQKSVAKNFLMQVHAKMTKLNDPPNQDESLQSDVSTDEEIETILRETGKNEKQIPNQKSISDVIQSFDNTKRLSRSTNILQFWEKYPDQRLKDIASTVLATSSTQVTVERAFSTLKFILSDRRANIDSDLLEDILLLNLN